MSKATRCRSRWDAYTKEVLADEVRRQMARKEQLVAQSAPGGITDVTPMLRVRRGGKDVVVATCADVDRDQALWFLPRSIPGYAADEIVMTTDAHVTTAAVNPATGKPWGPHEMQRMCDNEGACATGLITDTIAVSMLTRDGRGYLVSVPYHVHKTAQRVVWVSAPEYMGADVQGDDSSHELVGYVPDTIRSFFARPVVALDDVIEQAGVDAQAARRIADDAVSTLLLLTGMYILSKPQP